MRPWNELSMTEKADVMKLAIEGGVYDLNAIRSGYNEYAKGGKIHIKPENRGKFTALKERTGHSASWFKEHGTPAQKKMATFALNARKWKHGDGGELDTYGEPQTFAGRMAEAAGASPSIVRGTDVISSVAQMTPWGHYIAATDLGRDLNRVYHKEKGAKKDAALDLLSMIPGISAPGLKAAENTWNTIRGNNRLRKALNIGIITGRVADFVDDTWGANKTSKALGGNLFDGTTEDSQQMKIGKPYYSYDENGRKIDDTLNYNISFPEIVITPDSRKSPAERAILERERRRNNDAFYGTGTYNAKADREQTELEKMASQKAWETSTEKQALDYARAAATGIGIGADMVSGLPIYSSLKGARVLSEAETPTDYVEGALWLAPLGAETYQAAKPVAQKAASEAAIAWQLRNPEVPADYMVLSPYTRTRIGDVEVNNPGVYYRQGTPEMVEDFLNKGVAEASQFPNPMFNQGELFYNFPKRKGFTLDFNRRGTNGLITTSEDMVPASGDAMPMPLSEVDEIITSRIPTGKITTKNATAYNWEPGYGYRKVAQEPPTVTWSEANNPTIAAAERGRRKLRRATNSSWNKERWSEAAPFENTNTFIEDLTRQVDEVPFNYSKTKAQLNAMGETAPRAPKKWKENGRDFTDYNTGLDVSIASDLGDKAYSTGIHEPIHYMTANSNGLDVGVARPVFGSNMDPVKLEFDAINSTIIPRGKRYQHFMVDYNDGLLPKINTQSWDYRHGNDYYLSKQENQTYLKEWFLTDVEPFLKNPNDAAEIERFLTMNPEVVENNYYVNTLMKENRPGTNKDYAKALSKMLYSILGTGATTTLLNK